MCDRSQRKKTRGRLVSRIFIRHRCNSSAHSFLYFLFLLCSCFVWVICLLFVCFFVMYKTCLKGTPSFSELKKMCFTKFVDGIKVICCPGATCVGEHWVPRVLPACQKVWPATESFDNLWVLLKVLSGLLLLLMIWRRMWQTIAE